MPNKTGKPIHDQPKLCEHILNGVTTSTVPLRIGPSSIPNAGSGLFVENEVPAGSEIFRSQPLLLVCEGNNNGICDYCLRNNNSSIHPDGRFYEPGERENVKISVCTRCKFTQYCSKDCQVQAWKSYHKYECSMLKEIKDHDKHVGALPQTLCRLLLLIKKRAILKNDLDVLVGLETNGDDHRARWMERDDEDSALEPAFAVAHNAKQVTGSPIDLALARELYCMLMVNAISVIPSEIEDQYGACLDLVVSLTNHSCDANSHVFFEGRELRCRALKRIEAGAEVTVDYHPTPRKNVLLRRKHLSECMLINCECNKCKTEMAEHDAASVSRQDHVQNLEKAQLDLQDALHDAERIFNSTRVLKTCIGFQNTIWEILKRGFPGGQWPSHIEPLPTIYRSLGGMYRDLHYVIGLEFVLKGTLYIRDHTGPSWVRDMLHLTKFILYIAQANEGDIKWAAATKNAELLDHETMRDVARGYVSIVCVDGKFAFGIDAKFVQALHKWAADIIDYPGEPEVCIEAFRTRFRDSQERLLVWACMNPDDGLKLPSSERIAELMSDIEGVNAGQVAKKD